MKRTIDETKKRAVLSVKCVHMNKGKAREAAKRVCAPDFKAMLEVADAGK